MSNGGIAVRVEGFGKLYQRGAKVRQRTLSESIRELFSNPFQGGSASGKNDFWALRDVSFEIREGEVVGILGRNGAGKSTLLKILARITSPTTGRAFLYGRVGALLEVGTGFHQELSGRENIFLNGAILGMTKAEIRAKFDEIVDFSEIGDFLDTPVKHYSSGMYVRLAFSIAAHTESEILIVDEVLAVGDVAFRKKCLGKMGDVSRQGRTVLFVSHNMAAVENLCHRGIVLRTGSLVYDGDVKGAIREYMNSGTQVRESVGNVTEFSKAVYRRSQVGEFLQRIEFYTGSSDEPLTQGMLLGDSLLMRVHFNLPKEAGRVDLGIGFDDLFGNRLFTAHSMYDKENPPAVSAGGHVFVCRVPSFTLMPGTYKLRIQLEINHREADVVDDAAFLTVEGADYYGGGALPAGGKLVMPQRWSLESAEGPGKS